MRSVNPANGKFIADYPEYTDAEVNKIISAVNEDAQRWKKTSFSDRGKLFQKASTLLRQKKKALASTEKLFGTNHPTYYTCLVYQWPFYGFQKKFGPHWTPQLNTA